jgi:hypothetical protein
MEANFNSSTYLLCARHDVPHVVYRDGVVRRQEGLRIDGEEIEYLLLRFELGGECLGRDSLAVELIGGCLTLVDLGVVHFVLLI